MLIQALKNSILSQKRLKLQGLCSFLQKKNNLSEKLAVLDEKWLIIEYNKLPVELKENFSKEKEFVLKAFIAIGEGEILKFSQNIPNLIKNLLFVERFYSSIGGIVGYHLMALKLIEEKASKIAAEAESIIYKEPNSINIEHENDLSCPSVKSALENLPFLSLILPVGGAGDRLNLTDSDGKPLPVATLPFLGKTLLEGIILDLQAAESLYYKTFEKRCFVPIAMMCSHAKDNYDHIISICESKNWFGRPKDSFNFFIQPSVPVITEEGRFVLKDENLMLKPGGHGVMWKLAKDAGIFDWLKSRGCKKSLVRQINNPAAGIDSGLLSFIGHGFLKNSAFGFASCQRVAFAAEGMNVLAKKGDKFYLSNVEYVDFEKRGMEDVPRYPGSKYSRFPCNTNILFVDIDVISKIADENPLPGLLINLKNRVTYNSREVFAGRLEALMQNASDFLTSSDENDLPSYITYNKRSKTISTIKRAYDGKNSFETPEGCFKELMLNSIALLKQCQFKILDESGVLFFYNPCLGPLYSIISQKIRGGRIAKNSELQLEIAEVEIENLDLDGSLIVESTSLEGKCTLKNVKVKNRGIDRLASNTFWKNEIKRKESFKIIIHGNGEFYAENVTFEGDRIIEVPDGSIFNTKYTKEENEHR